MQRILAAAAVVGVARSLAPCLRRLDGDDLGIGIAQARHPGHEAIRERLRRQGIDHVVERVVRGNAVREGQKPAPERLLPVGPARDLHEILRPRHRPAQHDQQHLRRRIDRLPRLARVLEGGKLIEQCRAGHGEPA